MFGVKKILELETIVEVLMISFAIAENVNNSTCKGKTKLP
jgi:hypothetical protein